MFIQTEATPNPATLKFIPGKSVLRRRHRRLHRQGRGAGLAARLAPVRHQGRARRVPRLRFHLGDQGRGGVAAPEADDPRRHHGALHVGRAGRGGDRQRRHRRARRTTRRTRRSSPPSRSCWRRACARQWPRTAATSPSRPSATASSICICAAPARAARARRRRCATASRTCCGTSARKCKRCRRSEPRQRELKKPRRIGGVFAFSRYETMRGDHAASR